MKLEMRFRPGDDVRAVWLLALAVFLGGSYYVQTRYQSAISASYDTTETLYRETVVNTRIIHQAVKLRSIQEQALADLGRVSHDTSISVSTADLLMTLHASAKRFGARIEELQPGGPSAVPAQKTGTPALQATALTIRVRGRFRGILKFIEDLSHHRTLINVSDTELALANDGDDAAEPTLEATVHATMYRLRLDQEKGIRLAAAP